MAEYTEISQDLIKFGYIKYSEIQPLINDGVLNPCNIIFTKDTEEAFIINKDSIAVPLRSRVQVFQSVEDAELKLNMQSSTYEGQLVSILDEVSGTYKAYSVQKRTNNIYYVNAIHDPNDYNLLDNQPIINKQGTTTNPIIIKDLEDGVYLVKGVYKNPETNETQTTLLGQEFHISTNGNKINIIHIDSTNMYKYEVNKSSNEVSKETFITDKVLTERERLYNELFVKEQDLDEQLQILDYIKRSEVESTVSAIVEEKLDTAIQTTIGEKVDEILEEKMVKITESEINTAFSN